MITTIHTSAHDLRGVADGSMQAVITSPPYWFCTGSHSERQRKLRPYSRMAGAALMTSDRMMPASSNSTTQAAPWARAENRVSAQADDRRSAGGPPTGSERGMLLLFS